ncbi:MAG TPA: hypothetical protein VLX61_14595 [Anaerolineales bacterium]|nr:hypothetical protein [Anaerolineales bacterium]
MSDSDAFVISVVQSANPSESIRQAVDEAGVGSSRVQDVIFGLDESRSIDAEKILSTSALACSAAIVSSSLRAVFFAAQSILSFDLDVVMVVGIENDVSTAILLAAPDAVGRWNLIPRARLAVRSWKGGDAVLRAAGIESKDVTTSKDGKDGARLIKEALNEMEEKSGRWGVITLDELALLIEKI